MYNELGWILDRSGIGIIRSCLPRDTGENQEKSENIGVPAKIRTDHLLNAR